MAGVSLAPRFRRLAAGLLVPVIATLVTFGGAVACFLAYSYLFQVPDDKPIGQTALGLGLVASLVVGGFAGLAVSFPIWLLTARYVLRCSRADAEATLMGAEGPPSFERMLGLFGPTFGPFFEAAFDALFPPTAGRGPG